MTYYTKVLLPDEKALYVGSVHWLIYVRAWFFLAIDVALLIALFLTRDSGRPFIPSVEQPPQSDLTYLLWALFVACFFLWPLAMLSAWLRRATTEIVVTDRRIIFKEGFIRRRTMEMNMNKVETVDVQQSILGRMLNFGTVMIRGSGSSYEPLQLVANPLALRTAIVAQ